MYRHFVTRQAIKCEECNDVIYSRWSGHFTYCRCGKHFIDTSFNRYEVFYTRVGGSNKDGSFPTLFEIEVEDPVWMQLSINSRLYGGEG